MKDWIIWWNSFSDKQQGGIIDLIIFIAVMSLTCLIGVASDVVDLKKKVK